MRLLIVNADDYGLTEGISEGILRAHRDGVVTSTSVIALGPALATTAPWLAEHPRLGLGAHLAAVGEDPPLLASRRVRSLVDADGALAPTWKVFLSRAAAGRIDLAELEAEFDAQMERLLGLGLRLDHVDTHQHLHLWPAVTRVVLRVASRHGIGAIRVIQPTSRRSVIGAGTATLARMAQRSARRAAFVAPEMAWGLDEAGHVDAEALVAAIARFGCSSARSMEIATHPGADPDPDRLRYQWGYTWPDELDALCDPIVADAVSRAGVVLGTFADLRGAAVR